MKKHYASIVLAIACMALSGWSETVQAQTTTKLSTVPEFTPFTRAKLYSWSDPLESYTFTGADSMRFRIMLPNSFTFGAHTQKYPILIFLHGSGEAGSSQLAAQDNEKQLLHGGQISMKAVQNNSFPGFLLYPQVRYYPINCGKPGQPGCSFSWNNQAIKTVKDIIDALVNQCDVDPDRIYLSGLSGGGQGAWVALSKYPEYFAATHIMSASVGYDNSQYYQNPMQLSQGGLDGAPTPTEGKSVANFIRASGADLIYNYYPTNAHNTWDSEYAKSDYFTWFLDKKKTSISVKFGQKSFCPESPISASNTVTLAVTKNTLNGTKGQITNYKWQLNGVDYPAGDGLNEITVNSAGSYTVSIYRPNLPVSSGRQGWSPYSDPTILDNNRPLTIPTPTITTNGKSTTLPSLDGSPDVPLYGPANKDTYLWSPGGATTQNVTVSTAGNYTVVTKEPAGSPFGPDGIQPARVRPATQGCATTSNEICVTTQDGIGAPAPPANFFAASTSQTSIQLSWDDRANNETGFEIYRTTTPGSGYTLITILPSSVTANPQLYNNTGLQAGVVYYYKMRTVNCSGGSAYTAEISTNTAADVTRPTAPVLSSGATSRTAINLSWTGATDNVGVTQYDVYQNGSLIGSTVTTTYVASSLVAFGVYNYVVKAKDAAGNVSPPSNQVNATAANTGLFYSFYTHTGITSTTAITTDGTLVKTGTINNFLTTPRTQTDNYAFIYEGFINIPTSGNYTFFTTSDDGSQLFINNVLNVNNDGLHGGVEKAGTVINLSAGSYPIKVTYFEATGGESIAVKWQGPGITKAAIPDAALKDNVTPPAALTAPITFTATAFSFSQIDLSWKDGSNNETGFEISRSLTSNGTYQVVYVAPAQTGTLAPSAAGTGTIGNWSNTGLAANTNYYYKIRAISANSASVLVNANPSPRKTSAAPTVPGVPSGLTATPNSATQVNLAWNTTASAISYEIQKSTNLTTGFVTIATVTAPAITYSDTQLNGHATVYYRIRALGNGGTTSGYSTPAIQAVTPNRAPAAFDIPDQSITANQATPAQTITATITDADGDPIAFTITDAQDDPINLPGVTYTDNGYGKLIMSFTSVAAGVYTIKVQASDGIATVTDSFTLNVSANINPVVASVSIDGVVNNVSTIPGLTTEEGRTLTVIVKVTKGTGTLSSPTIANLPAFAAAVWTPGSPGTYKLTFTPAVGQAGITNNITVTFKDDAMPNGMNIQTFSLTVAAIDKYFSISLNFAADAAHYESSPWNNTGVPSPTAISNLKDDQGSNVRFVTFNNATNWGAGTPTTLPSSPTAVYTQRIRESYFSKNSSMSTLTFHNLNPALKYNLILYGAYPGTIGATSITTYTITGLTAQIALSLNTINNTDNPVSLPSPISPALNGDLTFTVGKGIPNTGSYYLNSAVLTAIYSDQSIIPASPSTLGLTASLYNKVDLTWIDNSSNENGFRISRSILSTGPYSPVGTVPANQTSYTDATTVGRITYYYKVEAYNDKGSSADPNATGVITTPNGAPVVANPGTITVRADLTLQTNISASDPEGDAVSFSVLNLPAFATLVDNGNNTGFIRFTPQLTDVGSYTLTLKGVDAFSGSTQLDFTLLVLDPEVDEAVYVNFTSTSAVVAGTPWNNLPINTVNGVLKNSLNINSAITISGIGGWVNASASDNAGTSTSGNTGAYPDKVLQSFWATNTTSTTGTSLTLSGLDNSKRYNITLLGSRNEFWFADAIYTVNDTSKTLHTSRNTANTVHFTGLKPINGSITIYVQKAANENTTPLVAHRDAPLNAMVIEGYTPGVPRRPTNLVAKGLTKTSIQLTWNDNSSNEDGFEIYRATSQSGPFNLITTTLKKVESYIDADLAQNTAYVYRVRAKTLPTTYSAYTDDAIASTYNQIILLNINSASSVGHLQAPTPPWNNTAVPPETGLIFKNFITDTNTPTPVDLEIVQFGGGGPNTTGYMTNNNSGVYPDAVLQNYYYFEKADILTQYKIRSLDKNFDYELGFMGDEWGAIVINGVVVATDFTVNGTTQSQFNGKNTTERVFFRNVHPEPDSTISFQIAANSTADYGVWNALEIRSYTPLSASFDTQAPTVPQSLAASDITDVSVKLTWKHASDNIGVTGYEIFQGSTLVATVSDTTNVVEGLQPQTTYVFSVRARDLKGNHSAFSNAVEVTTLTSSTVAIYYRPVAGDISLVASWADSVGQHPTDFISDNQIFLVNDNASLDSDLIISGSNTKLIVDAGKTLTLNSTLTTTVDANANASIIVNAAASPQFGKLAPTSTVTFSGSPNAVPGASYGNMMLTGGTNSTKNFSTGIYTVNGNLTIDDGVSLSGSTNNSTQLNVSGDLTLVGAATMPADDNLLFSINFNSGGVQKLTANQLNMRFHNLHVSDGTQLNVISSGALANTLTLGTALGGGLTIDDASAFNLADNSLTIQGKGTVNGAGEQGAIMSSKGSISVLSTDNQVSNLYFVAGADTVKTIGVNANAAAQVNVKTKMYVSEVVNLNNGKLNSAGNVVLVSDANGTARIASILNSGVVLGDIEFQRYISPKGRVWRYLSTPIYDTKISDWQTYIPITGNFTGTSTGPGITKNPSLYYYDGSNGGYQTFPVATNQEKFEVGLGYSLFYREAVNPNKLRLTGPVKQGDFTFNILSPGESGNDAVGWNLLGNPYPSPIEWDNVNWQSAGIDGTVYIRSNYSATTGDFKVWNENGIGDDDFKGIISPGQAFWVRANGDVDATLHVNENIKYDSIQSGFFRKAAPINHLSLTLSSGESLDKTYIHFTAGATDEIDHDIDAIKLVNDVFNFSTVSQNTSLAINSLPEDFCSKSIWLNLADMDKGTYTMRAKDLSSFDYDVTIKLVDHYKSTEFVMDETNAYTFDVDAAKAATFGKNRFELVVAKPTIRTDVVVDAAPETICEGDNARVTLSNTQPGATYKLLSNNKELGSYTSSADKLDIDFNDVNLSYGNNVIELKAAFPGCDASSIPASLAVNYKQTFSATASGKVICEGDSATLQLVSDAPANSEYKWYTDASSQHAVATSSTKEFNTSKLVTTTHYFVSVASNGCERIDRSEVVVEVEHLSLPQILAQGQQLTSNAQHGNQWNYNDSPISGATDAIYKPTKSGDYSVTVAEGACERTSDAVEFIVTSLQEAETAQLSLHPNPVKNRMRITLTAGVVENAEVNMYIYNAQGILVRKIQRTYQKEGMDISASDLSSGFYLMIIESNGKVVETRFVKE